MHPWQPGFLYSFPFSGCSFYLVKTYHTRSGTNPPAPGIPMRKEQIAIIVLAVWLTVISVFMVFAESVNYEIFFVLSLIGLLT
jgi:uncharacterized membrane-anchored protein